MRSPQTLGEADRRLVAGWAADCAERVLGLFEAEAPGDDRPRAAIARARAYARGELATAAGIRRRFAGGVPAGEVKDPAAYAAARAAGQAVAVCHMGAHALGAAAYAARAAGLAAPDRPDAAEDEVRWQLARMTVEVRTALRSLPPVGKDRSGPLGPGLLASGPLGELVRRLQAGLAPGARYDPRPVPSRLPRRPTSAEVASELAARDPVLAGLVARYGPPRSRRPAPVAERFGALCRMICYQQLAGNAARAIHGRFTAALEERVTPERLLATPPATLAACGLSANKAAAVYDLAAHVADGRVDLRHAGRAADEEVVAQLVQVRGIGPWTAQLFLLAVLGRPDVWPVGDYGVRVGFHRAWSMDHVPTPAELLALGEPFRPHRSAVARYCWLAADDKGPA